MRIFSRTRTDSDKQSADSLKYFLFSPKFLNRRIFKDRASATRSWLRWFCPLPSDRAIPGLWQCSVCISAHATILLKICLSVP